MDFEVICKKIRSLDSKIRFAGMVNNQGRLVAGGMKEDKTSLEDKKDD